MSSDVSMTFDIYGKMRLQIKRANDAWLIYRLHDFDGRPRRSPYFDIAIPPEMPASGIQTFLDDMFHEGGGGKSVRLITTD